MARPRLYEVSEAQEKRRPFHAAMRGEFDRFTPVPVPEDQHRRVAFLGELEGGIGPDPFRRSRHKAPPDFPIVSNPGHLEIHLADLCTVVAAEPDIDVPAGRDRT